jgi:hypothetical protein
MTILVAGGTGLISSNFFLNWFKNIHDFIIKLELLTFACNLVNIIALKKHAHHHFVKTGNSRKNPDKSAHLFLLTPKGMAEYHPLIKEIDSIQSMGKRALAMERLIVCIQIKYMK